MFGIYSYHGTIRKYAQIFSALFADIKIERENKGTGKVEQVLTVPLGYGPRAQWIIRSTQDPQLQQKIAQSLPRMSFEMNGMIRDSSRSIIPIQRNSTDTTDRERRYSQFAQIPYNFSFELSVLSNNEDDAWQVLEQILPYFQPDLSFNTDLIPEMKYSHEVTFTLDSMSLNQPYEGDLSERRVVVWTLSFTCRGYLYGPVDKQGVIKKAIADIRIPPGIDVISANDVNTPVAERYTVRPGLTADGQPTFDEGQSIPYASIKASDNYAYIERWERSLEGWSTTFGSMPINSGASNNTIVVAPWYWLRTEW